MISAHQIKKAASDICSSKNLLVLTGAGISVESGIPPFRGNNGLWTKFDPIEFAHIKSFKKNPEKIWDIFLRDMKKTLDKAEPNIGHKALFQLQEIGLLSTIITQNIDRLHQCAGNKDVIEFHGNFASYYCMECGESCSHNDINLDFIPPRCRCGGLLRPDCIFFGEIIPRDVLLRSEKLACECDTMVIIGTSAVVQPFASLPVTAKKNKAKIIEINPEKTPLTGYISNYILQGKSGDILPLLINEITNFK